MPDDTRSVLYLVISGAPAPEGVPALVRLLQEDAARTPEAVLNNCDRHVRIDDQDAVAHLRRGLTLLLLGREAEAAVALDRSRELLAGATEPVERLVKVVRAVRGGRVG